MSTSSRNRVIAVLAILLVIGMYIIWERTKPQTIPNASDLTVATSTFTVGGGTTTKSGGYTITQLPSEDVPPPPDYRTQLTCASAVSAQQCTTLRARMSAITDAISTNSTDIHAWVQLGSLRKDAGDYRGAEAAWQYASLLDPKNKVSFNNLGDLYMNFLHLYSKAESNYLIAVANHPTNTALYATLYTMYTTTTFKGVESNAEAILKKGIAVNPNAVDLHVLLARHYRSIGKTADARASYDAAAVSATIQGQTDIAAQIKAEAATL